MKSLLLIITLLIPTIGTAKEISVPSGKFERINLGQSKDGLSPIICDFEIFEEHRDTEWGPAITLGLTDLEDNEFIQVLFTTTKQDKFYLFSTKNGSIKLGDIKSHFLSLPKSNGSKVSLYIRPWDESGGTFDYGATVGEDIRASGYVINPYLRKDLSYSVTFSSVSAQYDCSFL